MMRIMVCYCCVRYDEKTIVARFQKEAEVLAAFHELGAVNAGAEEDLDLTIVEL